MTAQAKQFDKRLIGAAVALFAVGFVLGQGNSSFSPFGPQQPDRPLLRMVAKAAKFGLWLMVVEPPPPDATERSYVSHAPDHINYREGW